MILFLDNYDSFTYNLYQYIGELYPDIQVVRNDEITLEEIEAMHPDALLISPGPGYPKDIFKYRIRRKRNDLIHITVFDCQKNRHDLCDTRRIMFLVTLLFI